MIEIVALILGVLYGLLVGIIPSAGATTGLVALFGFLYLFPDVYLALIFIMATVAASTTADTFSSVLLGIPGANSSAATIQDGYPLAKKGKAELALSAAMTSSTFNGLLWGVLVFCFIQEFDFIYLYVGSKELWVITLLSFFSVILVLGKKWYLGVTGLFIGILLALIGTNPVTNVVRGTFGWNYLNDGLQLMPVIAGIFAVPELYDGLRGVKKPARSALKDYRLLGILSVLKYKWISFRGGMVGAVIGFLPGLGGAIADWIAYGQTVASNRNEIIPFGKGNIKGVIGCEGANNAQKATSMITTILFGIPGAPFAAVVIALLMYLNIELGDPSLFDDDELFFSMILGFLGGTILVFMILLAFLKRICYVTSIPFIYYFPILLLLITWSCVQYTGGWEDYFIFILMGTLGIILHRLGISKPALIIGFILFERFELLTVQLITRYL